LKLLIDEMSAMPSMFRPRHRNRLATRQWVLAAIGVLLICGTQAPAQEVQPAATNVADVLSQPIDLSAVERPLVQVIVALERRLQIPIFFDNDIVPGSAAFGQPTVTCDFQQVPFGQALHEILTSVSLDYVVRDNGLLIVTREKARLLQRWPSGSVKSANEARLTAALEHATELDFNEQPLSDVAEYLKQSHQIDVQLDRKALQAAGAGSDTPITLTVKGITLESALDLLLSDLGLTWVIHDEVLLITSKSAAQGLIETRVYPVYDLVMTPPGQLPSVDGLDYDALLETLAEAAPAEDGATSPIRVYKPAGALIVTRSVASHRRIEKLLSGLRRAKAGQSAEQAR
jgi:type II secretory pathway component GspD/PulD (secretin)